MLVEVLGISQDYSFQDGETINYLVVALPSGQTCRSVIDSESAQLVVQEFLELNQASGVAHSTPQQEPVQARPMPPMPPAPQVAEEPDVMPMGDATAPAVGDQQAYSPAVLRDDDGTPTFGGNTEVGLELMQEHLDRAASMIATVSPPTDTFGPEEIRKAAAALSQPQGRSPPQPGWGGSIATVRPVITADEQGNPVVQGRGIVDTHSLVGGDGSDEEDGVGSI